MRIYLEKGWSQFVDYQTGKGTFVGRKREIQHLVAYLLNNDSGSVMVSGIRGSGKTSFVYKVISTLIGKWKGKKTVLPIIINASQLELAANSNPKEVYRNLIEGVIRRLYATVRDKGGAGQDGIEKLYKKVQGVYRESTTRIDVDKEEGEERESEEKKFSLSVPLNAPLLALGVSISIIFNEIWLRVLGLLLALLSVKFSFKKGIVHKLMTGISIENIAKKYYAEDNSVGNLEYDLTEFLDNASKRFKFVFIIDELDKLNSDKDREKSLRTIQLYKNLFTLSKANFIFITDQKDYKIVTDSDKETHTFPTLFTQKYFIVEPSYADLLQYFDEIISHVSSDDGDKGRIPSKLGKSEKKKLLDLRNYLIYISEMNFFDLKNKISSLCGVGKDHSNYLGYEDIFGDELQNRDCILRSRLLEMIIQIYDNYKFRSLDKYANNQKNLHRLFTFLKRYLGKPFIYNISANAIIGEPDNLEDNNKLLRSFVDYLTRMKMLTKNISGDNLAYQWTNRIPQTIPSSPTIKFPNEERFLEQFSNLISTVNDIEDLAQGEPFGGYVKISKKHDAQACTGIPTYALYDKYAPIRKKLEKDSPEHVLNEELEKYISEIDVTLDTINEKNLETIANALNTFLQKKEFSYNRLQIPQDQNILSGNTELRNLIQGYDHFILKNKEKEVVLVKDLDPDHSLSKSSLEWLYAQREKVYLFNITKNRASKKLKCKTPVVVGVGGKKKTKEKIVRFSTNYSVIEFTGLYRTLRPTFNKVLGWVK